RATLCSAASRSRSGVRSRNAASSTMSAGHEASLTPAAPADAASGPDTRVLRIQHVGTHDLELERLPVNGRSADETRADALPSGGEEGEAHPALELGGWRGGGDVAEARVVRPGGEEVHPVAQPARTVYRMHADELQPFRGGRLAARECPADEVAALLQHALEPQVVRARVAVELRGR